MKISYFLNRLGDEEELFIDEFPKIYPNKGDFICFQDEIYKVIYRMIDYDYNEFNVFVRKAIEEDF